MTKSRDTKITDVDEIAAEAQASLEMIRAAAQQIQQLAAIRSRFEDMAQKYVAMNKRADQLADLIEAGDALHREVKQTTAALVRQLENQETRNNSWFREQERELRQTAETLTVRWQEQVANHDQWQREMTHGLGRKLEDAEQTRQRDLKALKEELLQHQHRQQTKIDAYLKNLQVNLGTQLEEVERTYQEGLKKMGGRTASATGQATGKDGCGL